MKHVRAKLSVRMLLFGQFFTGGLSKITWKRDNHKFLDGITEVQSFHVMIIQPALKTVWNASQLLYSVDESKVQAHPRVYVFDVQLAVVSSYGYASNFLFVLTMKFYKMITLSERVEHLTCILVKISVIQEMQFSFEIAEKEATKSAVGSYSQAEVLSCYSKSLGYFVYFTTLERHAAFVYLQHRTLVCRRISQVTYQPKSEGKMVDIETLTFCISLNSSQMCTYFCFLSYRALSVPVKDSIHILHPFSD